MSDAADLLPIREAVRALCADFPGEYWRSLDRERAYPTEFVDALTQAGFLAAACVYALDHHVARLAGKPLAVLDEAKRDAVVTEFRKSGGAPLATLARVILQCYYRDDRVLRSLGSELRAPFPKGHVLPDGDWSILDPVKAKGGSLRRAP